MTAEKYPRLEINLNHLQENVKNIVGLCAQMGIEAVGVIKGTNALPRCVDTFVKGGCNILATSRMEQAESVKKAYPDMPVMLLRLPMLSEAEAVVRICDYSLNSETETVTALNAEAQRQQKTHSIIMMADLGDLREGFWDKDEFVEACAYVESECENVELAGIGTNLGCYGSIAATREKMDELVSLAERVEERIGRRLRFISGGATTSLPRVLGNDMPERVNMLRIGEGILLSHEMANFYDYDVSYMHLDTYVLKAQVIEVKDKPTYPQGEMTRDCFGKTPYYADRGIRRRALLAVGRFDYGSIEDLIPEQEGIAIVGASSDHTILDVEDAAQDIKIGDVLSFRMTYAAMLYLTNSRNVEAVYV